MKRFLFSTLLATAVLMLTLSPMVFAADSIRLPAGTLDAKELRQLFIGKTVQSLNVKNKRISLTYYDPSGKVRQLRKGKLRSGKWKIKDNGRICLKMGNARNKCRIVVFEQGEYKKYIVKKDGRHKHVIDYRSFITGNPHNL